MYGEEGDAAGALGQEGLAGLHICLIDEVSPGRESCDRELGCFFICKIVGCFNEGVSGLYRVFGEEARGCEAGSQLIVPGGVFSRGPARDEGDHDAVAFFPAGDLVSDIFYYADAFGYGCVGEGDAEGDPVLDYEEVMEFQRGGGGLDEDFVLADIGGGDVSELEVLDAELIQLNGFHGVQFCATNLRWIGLGLRGGCGLCGWLIWTAVPVDPEAEEDEDPLVLGGPADGVGGWGKGGKGAGELVNDEEGYEEPEGPLALAVFCVCGSEVEDQADGEEEAFGQGCEEGRVPETETEVGAVAWEEGKVGFVNDEVEEPVAGDAEAKNYRAFAVLFYKVVYQSEAGAPYDAHEEAVGDGVGRELEGKVGVAFVDVDVFDVEEQEDGPEKVDPLGCHEEKTEGKGGCEFFCAEADAEMT